MTKSKSPHAPLRPLEFDRESGQQIAQIVRRATVYDPDQLRATERALRGKYRVIHGTIEMPRPPDERLNADGSEIFPKTIAAHMGDVVEIGDEDAARFLDADVVERLDARPSRVGKVWAPPPVLKNALMEIERLRARKAAP